MKKDLPEKEKPHIIAYIELCEYHGWPVGIGVYEQALMEYPEYFPEEIEYRKKFALIPEHVHQEFTQELVRERDRILEQQPHRGKGIIFYIDNPKEYEEYDAFLKQKQPELDAMEEQLHDKYYKPYNIQLRKWK